MKEKSRPDRDVELVRKESEVQREKFMLELIRWESDKERLKTLVKEKGRKIELLKQQIKEKDEKIENLTSKLGRLQEISSQANWSMSQNSTQGSNNRIQRLTF